MSTSTIVLVAVPALVILAGAVAFTSLRRRDGAGLGHLSRETRQRDAGSVSAGVGSSEGRELERSVALERVGGEVAIPEPKAPAVWTPPDAEQIGVTRRQFLNRSAITLMGVSLSTFGAANIAFLWPRPSSGFGSKIKVGKQSAVDAVLAAGPDVNFAYFSEAQSYIQSYPVGSLEAAREIYTNGRIIAGMEQGYTALWQKCPHLGCKVPTCASSQWFECPCHGSQYNRVGEKKAGPAPRGMDRFPVEIDADGNLFVDTGAPSNGPAIGTDTTGQGLEGPHC
jgi:cytochrome b6-f complex iron-sulfur subunit